MAAERRYERIGICNPKISRQVDLYEETIGSIPRGGGWIPAGYHPMGYKISKLGVNFLDFDGSLESDIGRFLASMKSSRKTTAALKEQWLEVMRVSKQGQAMRIYRKLKELLEFCLACGLID
jgi:hypothetical protein